MALPAITGYDDEKLEALRLAVLIEQERRQALANIPGQILMLAGQYVDGGGEIGDLSLTV